MHAYTVKTSSGMEILTLHFRPAQGPLPKGPTTMSTNGIYITDPRPELLEEIAALVVQCFQNITIVSRFYDY